MVENNPTIEVVRKDHKLTQVTVIMPIWLRNSLDGNRYLKLPLLGFDTFAKSDELIDQSIEEAIKCFCMASEKFGLGLEHELEIAGWKKSDKTRETTVLTFHIDNPAFEDVMETGENKALFLAMDESELACA